MIENDTRLSDCGGRLALTAAQRETDLMMELRLLRLAGDASRAPLLLIRLAGGESPQHIADDHGVALSTVRSQMPTVFEKVGVNRQADLVAALAAIPALG